jgi:hypothetical protein
MWLVSLQRNAICVFNCITETIHVTVPRALASPEIHCKTRLIPAFISERVLFVIYDSFSFSLIS